MTQTAIYLRLSKTKDDPTSTTDSIETQRNTVHTAMRNAGLDPAAAVEYVDILSARKVRTADRPGWSAMEDSIRAGHVTTIWTRHVDRLYRHLTDLGSLCDLVEQTGVTIRTAWSGDLDLNTAAGRTSARIMASIAQGEVETMIERVYARLASNRAAGRPHGGGTPYGWNRVYDDKGKTIGYEVDEVAAGLIRTALQMVLDGESLGEVERYFARHGARTAQGNPISRANLNHILKSPRLTGKTLHKGEVIGEGLFPPITDEATYGAVMAVLSDPKRRTNGQVKGRHPMNLLTQIAICAECGATMRATTANNTNPYFDKNRGKMRGGSGKRYERYQCRNGCQSISRPVLDSLAVSAMATFWTFSDVTDLAPTDTMRDEMKALLAQRGTLDGERQGVMRLLGKGLMTEDEAESVLGDLTQRGNTLSARIETLSQRFDALDVLTSPLSGSTIDLSTVADLAEAFRQQPVDKQRRQIEKVFKVIVRRPEAVGPVTVGDYTEELSQDRKTVRRVRFECLVKPTLVIDPYEADVAALDTQER